MSDCYSDRMLETLVTRLPGASENAIKLEMGNAAHEWFLESGCWHEVVWANMIEDRTRYELWTSTGAVGYICDLSIEGRPYRPVTANALVNKGWIGAFQVLTEFGTIEISPAPTETKEKAIWANVTVVPDDCGCDIPADILNHYYEALLDTTLGKMYSHVSKPYSNPSLAAYHIGRYRAHLTRARRIVAGGNVRAAGPWVYPQIAPGKNMRGYAFPRGA